MAQPAQSTASGFVFLKPTLNKVWGTNIKGKLDHEDSGFDYSTSKDFYIDDQERASTGPMRVKVQNELAEIDSSNVGFGTRYYLVSYAQRVLVSYEMKKFSKYDEAVNGTKDTAQAAKLTQEYTAASVPINAYTAGFTGGDGVVLGSLSHTLVNGGLYANMFSSFMSLSETALETMWANASQVPDSNGWLVNGYQIKKLVVPAQLEFQAMRLLKSAQQALTANNAINAFRSKGVTLGVNRYLTSTTQYYGVTNVEENTGLRFIWGTKPDFFEDNDGSRMTTSYVGYEQFAVGWTNPRAFYGSNSAG